MRWNRSIFPVVVGAGRGEQVIDAVLPAEPVEEHLAAPALKRPGEDLAVIGQDLLRHAIPAPSPAAKCRAHRPLRRPWHQPRAPRTNREWSSTPVSTLNSLPSPSRIPPTTSSCHNSIGTPRSHRLHCAVPAATSLRRDQPVPRSTPDRPPSGTATAPPPPGQASCTQPARPHPGCAAAPPAPRPRPPPVHLVRALGRHVRPVASPANPVLVPAQPPMHGLPRHPEVRAPPQPSRPPSRITARTA